MATFEELQAQGTADIRTYRADYTDDLAIVGGTVSAGTAFHIPPSGAASVPTVTFSSPYVYATIPVQSVLGLHYLDIIATFSGGGKATARVPFAVVFPSPTARTGMTDILSDLRSLTDTSPDDYSIAEIPYWTDAQLQRILDNHRTDLKWVEMTAWEEADGTYTDYEIGYGNLEATTGGTAIFIVQDLNGATVTSPTYTVDYQRGLVSFASDTGGTAYWVTARSYDLNGAASEVWRKKQSHYAAAVNFSTKVHNIQRSQLYEHAKERAEYFEGLSAGGFGTMDIFRSDTDW